MGPMRRHAATFVLALAVAVAAAPWAAAQTSDDDALVERVKLALAQNGLQSVDVRIDDGVTVLSGVLDSAREKILAIQAAFSIDEVEAVDTEIRLRVGVTPEIEEEIWFMLIRDGVAEGIEELIVDDGIASIRGRVADEATRDRILAIAREAQGVEAVTSGIVVAAAPTPAAKPDPESVPTPPPAPVPVEDPEPAPEAEPEPGPEAPPNPEPEPTPRPEPPPAPEPRAHPEPAPTPTEEPAPAPPVPESRPEPDLPEPPTRADLPNDVANRILSSPDYTVFDHVRFSLDGGTVVLGGSVTTEAKKENLEQAIAGVPGVQNVQNELHVLSSASEDERMRERLFRRIYQDPAFAQYADLPNPPIHIIVEAQHVTLEGVVDTRLLQMSAESIARTTFGVRSVRNALRIRE